jgi:hypothetical protein
MRAACSYGEFERRLKAARNYFTCFQYTKLWPPKAIDEKHAYERIIVLMNGIILVHFYKNNPNNWFIFTIKGIISVIILFNQEG